MSVPCTQAPSNPCLPCAGIDNTNVCGQTLVIDPTTGDLFITPNGNTVNLCESVRFCETRTLLSDVDLVGTVLQVTYIGEDGIPQSRNADLSSLVSAVTASITAQSSNSIALTYHLGILRADLQIDPASTISVSAGPNGVLFGSPSETAITANTSDTIQMVASGSQGHVLVSNLKFQSTPSVMLSSSSAGLQALVNYSTDPSNVAIPGSDGGVYVQSAASQLSALPLNGNAIPNFTQLVGSDSKLYTIPGTVPETVITPIDTSTLTLNVSGLNGHTIQGSVNLANSNSIGLVDSGTGIQANIKIDNPSGNVTLNVGGNGLSATLGGTTLQQAFPTAAVVSNPITKVYGQLNGGTQGYAAVSLSQYGIKTTQFTATQIAAITAGDLYDTLFVFNTTARHFQWYDAVNSVWVAIS